LVPQATRWGWGGGCALVHGCMVIKALASSPDGAGHHTPEVRLGSQQAYA
jgi:hypothetical protein